MSRVLDIAHPLGHGGQLPGLLDVLGPDLALLELVVGVIVDEPVDRLEEDQRAEVARRLRVPRGLVHRVEVDGLEKGHYFILLTSNYGVQLLYGYFKKLLLLRSHLLAFMHWL